MPTYVEASRHLKGVAPYYAQLVTTLRLNEVVHIGTLLGDPGKKTTLDIFVVELRETQVAPKVLPDFSHPFGRSKSDGARGANGGNSLPRIHLPLQCTQSYSVTGETSPAA